MADPREPLGHLVREVWVAWAKEQPDPKPSLADAVGRPR